MVFLDPDGLALRFYTAEETEPDESEADVGSPWLQTSPDASAASTPTS